VSSDRCKLNAGPSTGRSSPESTLNPSSGSTTLTRQPSFLTIGTYVSRPPNANRPSLTSDIEEFLADLPSPTDTEIIVHDDYVRSSDPGVIRQQLEKEGIKIRDFAYEPFRTEPQIAEPKPVERQATETWDPVDHLLLNDWHMRNPEKNPQLNKPRDLWHLLKMGWIKLTEVTTFWKSTHYRAAIECEQCPGDSPSGRWVDAPASKLPTPEERVRRRMAWLPQREDDLPETMFFGYEPAPELQTSEVQQPKAKRRRTTLGFPMWGKKSLERTSSRAKQTLLGL